MKAEKPLPAIAKGAGITAAIYGLDGILYGSIGHSFDAGKLQWIWDNPGNGLWQTVALGLVAVTGLVAGISETRFAMHPERYIHPQRDLPDPIVF